MGQRLVSPDNKSDLVYKYLISIPHHILKLNPQRLTSTPFLSKFRNLYYRKPAQFMHAVCNERISSQHVKETSLYQVVFRLNSACWFILNEN